MDYTATVKGDIKLATTNISGGVSFSQTHLNGEISIPRGERYSGDYRITPTTSTQVIAIAGKTATQDITIDPIPSNYGLITWNGSTITVS